MDNREKTIVICSGGVDSTTLAYYEKKIAGLDIHLLAFNYNQRHSIELDNIPDISRALGVTYSIVDISSVGKSLKSALTTADIDVPVGEYTAETLQITVVPNRNAIMLSIACGMAISMGVKYVSIGVHSGDHAVYPDCRPEFIYSFQKMASIAAETLSEITVRAPFIHDSKNRIVEIGKVLQVPYELTWSCYNGVKPACGHCSTCVERRKAFLDAELVDPIEYA